ncbi:hypothetical protein NCCP133_28360 [Cytobacillus sp. NCCP-133]|nr:hypothetical protein NCCP133_28360 [Cytobacillus sp. NCCP-133]
MLKSGKAFQVYDVPAEKIIDFRKTERIFEHAEKPLFPYVKAILEKNNLNAFQCTS